MLLIHGSFCWTRAFNEEDNNLCFENCASTFFKKVCEFVNAQVVPYVRVGMGATSQRVLGHAVHFDSRFALQNVPPPAECVGKLPPFRPYVHVLHAQFSNLFWG